MRFWCMLVWFMCCIHLFVAAPSRAGEPKRASGRISGAITSIDEVTRVAAVNRSVKQKRGSLGVEVEEFVGRISDDGRRYEIDVPAGTYDLHLETKGGKTLEGVDLRLPSREPLRCAVLADIEAITAIVKRKRPSGAETSCVAFRIQGRGARGLVELVSRKRTGYERQYGGPVELHTWELWEFVQVRDKWTFSRRVKELRRFVRPTSKTPTAKWQFKAKLGGVDVAGDSPVVRDVRVE